jgi:hypothetical protein
MTRDFQQAWESYLTLCRKSAAGYFTDMIQEVGLSNPFEEKTIENLVQQLNEYIP